MEAVRLVPPQNRGRAMGAYTAFLDAALGFGTPALGYLTEFAGLDSAFVASMLAALGAAGVAGFLLNKSGPLREHGRPRRKDEVAPPQTRLGDLWDPQFPTRNI